MDRLVLEPAGPERIDVVTVGEPLVALVASQVGPLAEAVAFRRHVGGAEANVAVGLVRLGRSAGLIGRIGGDGFGLAILRRLRGEGVDISALTVDPDAQTGLVVRERRAFGRAEVHYYRAGSAGARLSPDDLATPMARRLFASARWLHLTGITPALSASAWAAVRSAVEAAAANGLSLSFDLNLRRKLWPDPEAAAVLRPFVGAASVLFGSVDELTTLLGRPDDPLDLAAAALELGPATVVVTLGPEGAVAASRDGRWERRPGLPVGDATDAVGAGDAFVAGWLTAVLEGRSLGEALEFGNACGASVVSAEGDQAGLPTRAELERLATPGPDLVR